MEKKGCVFCYIYNEQKNPIGDPNQNPNKIRGKREKDDNGQGEEEKDDNGWSSYCSLKVGFDMI